MESKPIHPANAAEPRLNQATASTLLSQLAFGSDAVQGVPYALRRDARRRSVDMRYARPIFLESAFFTGEPGELPEAVRSQKEHDLKSQVFSLYSIKVRFRAI